MNTLIAYHGKKSVKTKYVNRVKAHAKADEIIKGTYWQNGKGCAVGCTIEGSEHERYETELGIPRLLARLEDGIFEGLPNERAMKFPLQFLEAVNVGVDLSSVFPKFMFWLLGDKKDGVLKYAKTDAQKKAIKRVIALYKNKIAGKEVTQEDWRKARSAAYAAAADADAYDAAAAAYAAAADADAADAAYAAAYAAAAAAAYAAYAAYAAAAAQQQARIKQADKLLELIKECN